MYKFFKIFCVFLSIISAKARPQNSLAAAEYHPYGIDLSKLEDELIKQAAAENDKLILEHLRNPFSTTSNYPTHKSVTRTTPAPILPETSTTPTTAATTTATTTTTATATAPFAISNSLEKDSVNWINDILSYKNKNPLGLAVYPTPILQQPIYSYFLVSSFNLPPNIHGSAQNYSASSPAMAGLYAAPYTAVIPQLTQSWLGPPGASPIAAYPYFPYPLQFISPVFNPQHFLKK